MGSHSSHVSNISFVFFLLLLLAVNYDLAAVVVALAFAVEKVILTCCVFVIAVRVLVIKLTVIVNVYILCVQCW